MSAMQRADGNRYRGRAAGGSKAHHRPLGTEPWVGYRFLLEPDNGS